MADGRAIDVLGGLLSGGGFSRLDPSDVFDLTERAADEGDVLLAGALRGYYVRSGLSDDFGSSEVGTAMDTERTEIMRGLMGRSLGLDPRDVAAAYEARENGDRTASDALELQFYTR